MTKSDLEHKFLAIWHERGPIGYELVSEYRFQVSMWHATEGWQDKRWRFDFAIPTHRVAIEIEGVGRHQFIGGFDQDCLKYNQATAEGWRVLRFMGKHLSNWESVISTIERTIGQVEASFQRSRPAPAPCPICGPECRC